METGYADIFLTDSIWRGSYTMINKNIILSLQNSPEVPEGTLVLQFINASKLKKADDKTIWNKMKGTAIWD
ncbi:hypothetical protein [Gillisia sp. Hel_I_86]|uniref:hypothetical protein n=1 Tax=Gillisia sp. Hel_I_86 TaxID=1249981 RepID=UPI0011AA7EF5|nr:hypothetical protein [Gillisia sp. Hel_I_86]